MPTAFSYAGVQLGFPDADGSIQKWLDRFRPIDEIFSYANPTSTVEGRDRPQGQTGHAVGLPRHNWTYQPPTYRINTLWWPCTGASRFAQGLFLTNQVNAALIQKALEDTDGSATLIMGDSLGSLQLRMWALPMRPLGAIATSVFPLVLVPLVDRRYFWQWSRSGQMFLGPESTWSTLINQITANLGLTIVTPGATITSDMGETLAVPDPVIAGYKTPDWSGFDLWHENAAMMLDAYAATVGERFVAPLLNGRYALRKAQDSVEDGSSISGDSTICQGNIDAAEITAGGEFLTVPAAAPGKLTVVFPRRQGGFPYLNGVCDTKSVNGPDTDAPGEVTIHTSFQADYSARASQPDNQSQLDSLAESIARDFFAWHEKQYSATIPGLARLWQATGFDDYLWFHFGASAPAGPDDCDLFNIPWLAHTIIESLPDNFGTEENLCQTKVPDAPRTFRGMQLCRVQLTSDFEDRGDLPAVASARILYADDYPPTGHLAQDGFDVHVFDTLGNRGPIASGDKVWVSALAADSEMFELVATSASLSEVVQVVHAVDDAGALVLANAQTPEGLWLHSGSVKRYIGNLLVTQEDCWILFVDDFDIRLGNIPAFNGQYYGPGKYSGPATSTANITLPLYVLKKGEEPVFVMVVASGKSDGQLVKSDDFRFDGLVVGASQQTDEQFFPRGSCVLTFIDYFTDSSAVPVVAEVGRIYGPCKLSVTQSGGGFAIFEVAIGEQEWEAKLSASGGDGVPKGSSGNFQLYNRDGSPSGIIVSAAAKYKKVAVNKWCIVKRMNRGLIGNQIEC